MLREEQRAMPAYEEPPVLPGGSFLYKKQAVRWHSLLDCIKTTTRYAGAPEKVLHMRRKRKPPMIE